MTKEKLISKNVQERAEIKSTDIVASIVAGSSVIKGVTIEIVSINKIGGGVEVFARAFENGHQIGFGTDGSVDIERFVIINPPIMVRDGTTTQVLKQHPLDPSLGDILSITPGFKEDHTAAILEVIHHAISVRSQKFGDGNIKSGKVGSTISTFYPDANAESTSVDGSAVRSVGVGSGANWATFRAAAGTTFQDNAATGLDAFTIADTGTDNWRFLGRGFFLFDTSALPDADTVTAATFSIFGSTVNGGKVDNFDLTLAMVDSTPASNTALAASDYGNIGSTRQADSDIDITSWSDSAYNDWTLNATGRASISKTGVTKFGVRFGEDLDNTAPTWSSGVAAGVDWYLADQADTTNDPKLVVTHSEVVALTPTPTLLMMGVG